MRGESSNLGVLLDLQRQVGELVRVERGKKRRRRRGAAAYSPPRDLPGPKPSPLDVARAKRLWRKLA